MNNNFVNYKSTFSRVLSLLIGLVFITSSWFKIQFPFEFLSSVYEYQLLGRNSGLLLAMFLPYFELTIGVLLIINLFTLEALFCVVISCLFFVIAQIWAIIIGLEISCACFSSSAADHVNYFTVGRTFGLLTLGIIVFYLEYSNRRFALNIKKYN